MHTVQNRAPSHALGDRALGSNRRSRIDRRGPARTTGKHMAASRNPDVPVLGDGQLPAFVRRVTVLIPAHNEGELIGTVVRALGEQTRRPERVIVVADNCSDDTVANARAAGAEVMETVENTDKKAGALNQALELVLPQLGEDEIVLVQDADSILDPGFVAGGLHALGSDTRIGAVGGTFRGQPVPEDATLNEKLLAHLQDNEYARYARDVRRLKGKCLVVTGTAAMFKVKTLKKVREARLAGQLPAGNGRGGIYDTSVLTEDNELSFAIMSLGFRLFSPKEMTLTTEVMPTWRELWNQRLRWKRGAVENCVQYGITSVTWRYWGRQLLTALGVVVTVLYLGSVVLSLFVGDLHIHSFWLAVTGIFVIERFATLHDKGLKYQVAAMTMYELPFEFFLQATHAKAYGDSLLGRQRNW